MANEDLKSAWLASLLAIAMTAYTVTVGDLRRGGLALILKDAIKPNLVQTIYGTPAFVHGGPFANIAHGCNSVLSTALRLLTILLLKLVLCRPWCWEIFFWYQDTKLCQHLQMQLSSSQTLRALKMNGGVVKDALTEENVEAVRSGFANLKRHVENIRKFGTQCSCSYQWICFWYRGRNRCLEGTLCLNRCTSELAMSGLMAQEGVTLVETLVKTISENPANYTRFMRWQWTSVQERIEKIVTEIYRAAKWTLRKSPNANCPNRSNGWDRLPICMAKTQHSFSDNPNAILSSRNFWNYHSWIGTKIRCRLHRCPNWWCPCQVFQNVQPLLRGCWKWWNSSRFVLID